jgi:hypothetical protein
VVAIEFILPGGNIRRGRPRRLRTRTTLVRAAVPTDARVGTSVPRLAQFGHLTEAVAAGVYTAP